MEVEQLVLNFDVDPIVYELEALIGETVEDYRQQKRKTLPLIQYYYVLTESSVYDVSLSDESQYCVIFHRYDRSILEKKDQLFAKHKTTLIERIFS